MNVDVRPLKGYYMFNNRFLMTLLVILLAPVVSAHSQEQVGADVDFKTTDAKQAIRSFHDRMKLLDEKLDEQIGLARTKLKKSLEAALLGETEKKNFAEVQRISTFLNSHLESYNAQPSRPKSNSASLKRRIKELEKQLEVIQKPDPIAGFWRYHNGNVTEYTPDGWLLLNSKPIGLWRRHSDGTYTSAYLNTFGSGTSDRMVLDPNGMTFELTDVKGKKVQITRVK